MRHVVMLIIFSRHVLIRATPVYVYTYSIDIGVHTVDSTALDAMYFHFRSNYNAPL
jgi:hypothetical protein